MTWIWHRELEGLVTKAEAEAMLDTQAEITSSTETRYKLIIADLMYEARMLPAANYRHMMEIARRGNVEAHSPLDYSGQPP